MTSSTRVYFDYAATAPLRPEARAAMLAALDTFGNPSSVHAEGQAARFIMDQSRREMAHVLGIRAERLVLTSGGTEANNLALRGSQASGSQVARILYSAIEHDCVLNTARVLGGTEIPVTENGVVNLDALYNLLAGGRVNLVSVMHANNETGVIQPLREAAALAHEFGALLHVDAVQSVGHLPMAIDEIGADLLSFSAHKFGGPKGAGMLVVKPEINMVAGITGGAQERNRRAGTENVLGMIGMAAALKASVANQDSETRTAREIAKKLTEAMPQQCRIVAMGADRLPHILQLRTPGRRGEDMVIAMDLHGIAVSQGSACSSGRVQNSHVLRAMGYDEAAADEGVRLSWGWASTLAEADMAAAALNKVISAQ